MSELTAGRQRLLSIDFLHGLVMVVMALDHVRDFFHESAMQADPTDLSTTTPALFLTRWITHFCAPIFVFLAGTSVYLSGRRQSRNELSLFLLKRGHWLILVELLLVSLGITFNPLYNFIILQVIWAIGLSMVLLAALIWLPFPAVLTIGLLLVLGHNLLDGIERRQGGNFPFIWHLAHTPNGGHIEPLGGGRVLLIA